MEIKLYYAPKTRAVRPRWLMEELQLEYELITVDIFTGETRKPWYKKLHPHSQVPVLIADEQVMFESGAICAWLTDLFPEKHMAPKRESLERATYEQWMYYVPATLEPPLFNYALHKFLLPESMRVTEILPWNEKTSRRLLKELNKHLRERQYLVADQFSTADIMMTSTLLWMPDFMKGLSNLENYCADLSERPAYKRAISNPT